MEEEQRLCKKCEQYLRDKYGPNFYMAPSNHCHHKEPEPCWCEEAVNLRIHNLYIYCPICRKKLERR